MARTPKPTALHELNGTYKKHPERRRGKEPKPTGPLGAPPAHLEKKEQAVWLELQGIIPPKVLTNADRWVVEIACVIMAKLRSEGIGGRYGVSVGELAQLNQCLSRMGMTPADRAKVKVAEEKDEDNPFTNLDKPQAGARPN